MPGTSAAVSSSILVITGPASRLSFAAVRMIFGGKSDLVSCADKNIEKHPV
jgi:hypothetical protein